jgi:hypothetical protein
VLSAIAHALALLAGLSIDVRLLPASIFMSALMALGIALLQLQTVQKDRSISAVRLIPLIPVVILLIAYALWSDTLVLATNGPEPVRQIGLELLEAGAIALMLSALGAWQWRGWRDRASNDQESAAVRKTV